MDNIIASVINQNLTPPPADKIVSGQIVEVPDVLNTLVKGDNLILKFFNNTNLAEIGNTLSVDLNVSGQSVPVDIKLDAMLRLTPQQPHQLVARVVSNIAEGEVSATRIQFQLVSVDNQRPENFVANFNAKTSSSIPMLQSSTSGEAPVIADLNNAAAQVKFVPQKLSTVLAQPLNDLNLPTEVKAQINAVLEKINVNFELKNINTEAGKVSTQAPMIGFEFPQAVRQALIPLAASDNSELPQLINNLKQLLNSLPQTEIPAYTEMKGSAVVLATPLGTVLPEASLKIKPDTSVVLQLKPDLTLPERLSSVLNTPAVTSPTPLLDNLATLFDKLNPLSLLKTEAPEMALAARVQTHTSTPLQPTSAPGIFDILASVNNAQLVNKIQNKIPLPNAKMLSNLVNFNRAAVQGDASPWLGGELVAELKSAGIKGSDVLQQLNQFVGAAVKENLVWRTVEIPFFDGAQLSNISVALKKSDPDEEKEETSQTTKKGRRFLVETDFSKLGKFQFDGFASVPEHRFDLVIRTSRKLEADFCSEVMNLFKTSLYNVGYVGNIKINQREKFINIHENSANQLIDGIYI